MPDNPHKSGEERLREYAQLRKGELGDGVKLSDTRRQRLLQEVDDIYNKQEDHFWILIYRSIWGKIAIACCGLLVCGLLLKNILEKPEMSLAKTDKISEKQVPATVFKTIDGVSLPRNVPHPPEPVALAEAPIEQPDKSVKTKSANIAASVKMEKLSPGSNSQTLQKSDRLYGGLPKEKVVPAGRTESTVSSATVEVKPATAEPASLSLTNYEDLFNKFKIEVKDSKVVIRGEDGSIYEGEFIDGSKSENIESVKKVVAIEQDNQPKLMGFAGAQYQNILSFTVKGINKTLNKPIEFTGKFVADVQSAEKPPVVAKRGLALNERRLGVSARSVGVESRTGRINNEESYAKLPDAIKSQTNIIEGVLSLNGLTNITIRAVINQDGFYQRETN